MCHFPFDIVSMCKVTRKRARVRWGREGRKRRDGVKRVQKKVEGGDTSAYHVEGGLLGHTGFEGQKKKRKTSNRVARMQRRVANDVGNLKHLVGLVDELGEVGTCS